jgi:hypothetical protein
MRALTIHQPWAWAIAHGHKRVENRHQGHSYRGTLLIHAGLKINEAAFDETLVQVAIHTQLMRLSELTGRHGQVDHVLDQMRGTAGCVIGVADLVDVHRDNGSCCGSWAERDRWHYVVEHPKAIQPIQARGYQGFWVPEIEVADEVREQVGPLPLCIHSEPDCGRIHPTKSHDQWFGEQGRPPRYSRLGRANG